MGTECLIFISNCSLPCIILKRSLVQVNPIILYFEKINIYQSIHFLFYCMCEYINNDVVNHQTTRHNTLGVVMAHVLMFDWKTQSLGPLFNFFDEDKSSLSEIGNITFYPSFVCYNKQLFFWIADEVMNSLSQTYKQCLYVCVCWYTFEHIR